MTVEKSEYKRLRIAVLNRVFSPTGGGAERYSIALVEELASRHEIHVFAQQVNHQWPGVTYHKVSAPLLKPRWINQLWYATATWWATRRGFDVVHSHENTWHGQVQTVHVLPVKYNLFHGRIGWRLVARYLKVALSPRMLAYLLLEHCRFRVKRNSCIAVTSRSLLNQMASTYPDTKNFLQLVTPGVSNTVGVATTHQQFAARQRLKLPEVGYGILFVGNDYRKKGLQTLLKALEMMRDDTWLAVVGNSSSIPEYQVQAKNAGILNKVIFLGPMNDVSDAYIAADCLAHPTLEDTFAMVVLEAMAHGLPVIVSSEQYCGISGQLTHQTDALILENPRDEAELSVALLRVKTDSSLRQVLSTASLEFASSKKWTSSALQQDSIYISVFDAASCKPSP